MLDLTNQALMDDEGTGLLVNKPTGKYKRERKEGATSFEAEGDDWHEIDEIRNISSLAGFFSFSRVR